MRSLHILSAIVLILALVAIVQADSGRNHHHHRKHLSQKLRHHSAKVPANDEERSTFLSRDKNACFSFFAKCSASGNCAEGYTAEIATKKWPYTPFVCARNIARHAAAIFLSKCYFRTPMLKLEISQLGSVSSEESTAANSLMVNFAIEPNTDKAMLCNTKKDNVIQGNFQTFTNSVMDLKNKDKVRVLFANFKLTVADKDFHGKGATSVSTGTVYAYARVGLVFNPDDQSYKVSLFSRLIQTCHIPLPDGKHVSTLDNWLNAAAAAAGLDYISSYIEANHGYLIANPIVHFGDQDFRRPGDSNTFARSKNREDKNVYLETSLSNYAMDC